MILYNKHHTQKHKSVFTKRNAMAGTTAVSSKQICIPPLRVSVFSVETLPVSVQSIALPQTSMRTHVGNLTQQLLSIDENKCTPSVYGVQLKPEQVMCVSCLHPNSTQSWCLSEGNQEFTMLPKQECLLSKAKTNLIFLAPSMQVKVMFCSQPVMAQATNANSQPNSQTQSNVKDSIRTHLFTVSLPLKQVLQQLMVSNEIVHQVITSEDENKVWQLHLSMADTTPVTAYDCQKRHEFFSLQLDSVMAHEAWVKSEMGYCETLVETATAVTAARLARKVATAAVLKKLTNDEMPTTWDLQMSRALGVANTPEGVQPMKLDQQAIEYLRVGCASGDQSQQSFLTFVNSLTSATVHVAQKADVSIGFDVSTQLAVFDPVAFHNANTEFIAKNGADALMHLVQLKCQENIVAGTKYESDPEYSTVLQMKTAHIDATGSGHIDFASVVVKKNNPGEDQKISTGLGPEDHGVLPCDCEDVGNGNAMITSQMLAFPEKEFLQSTEHAMTYFPPSVQQISRTLLTMAQVLHQQENANMRQRHGNQQVDLQSINMNVLQNLVAKAKANPGVRIVSTCSLLAKATQIAEQSSSSAARDKILAGTDITLGTFCDWWGNTQDNGLNGHSVCVAMKCSPVLSTNVNGVPVNVTLVSANPDIIEGTSVARETAAPATQMATLNVTGQGQCSQQRLMLQQRLDKSGFVLNSSTAANIKSSLHAAEMTQLMTQTAINNNVTGLSMGCNLAPKSTAPKFGVPIISAVQSYSLNGESATTAEQRQVMINTMFYAVGLACGIGPMYSIDMRDHLQTMQTGSNVQVEMEPSDAMSDAMRMQAMQKIKICPGTPFMRGLLQEQNMARIVVAAQCSDAEQQRLRTLGAFMGLNRLDAESYLKIAPSSFMPLHLRQSLTMCPVRNCLTALSSSQMQNIDSFACGVFAKSPFITPVNTKTYASSTEIEANMHAIYTNSCNVVRCLPVVTGTGYSDSMVIVYP
jgi:hypothetical protein